MNAITNEGRGRGLRLLLLFIFALVIAGCAAKYRPEEERTNFVSFSESLYQGMPRSELMKEAGRKPLLTGIDLDEEHMTFQFRTPGQSASQYYQYVYVVVDRASRTVKRWE